MIKNKFFIVLLSLTSFVVSAQYDVVIEAFILDYENKEPIPYVNIGFVEKSIGTVSNEQGKFKLVYDDQAVTQNDVLQISVLGYETIKVTPRQLELLLTNTNKIYLNPKSEALSEILITDERRKEIQIGQADIYGNSLGYWKDKDALGGEIASRIKIKNENTRLLEFKFKIAENQTDSLKVRINVYDYQRRYPSDKLLKTNLYKIIAQKEGIISIDLEPYNLIVDDDVVIGMELIEVYGNSIEFAVGANEYHGASYRRQISQDSWKRYPTIGMNFEVLTSIPLGKNEVYFKPRENPKNLTLYWDASSTIADINKRDYFIFLEDYLNEIKNANIELVTFSNTIQSNNTYQIANGNSEDLINNLKAVQYIGAVNYEEILKENNFEADAILLFTDGYTLFEELEPEINIPIFCISANEQANHLRLQKTAFYADGHYINLNRVNQKTALELILNEVDDKTDYTSESILKNNIEGKIFSISGSIQGATIRVKNSFIEAQSDVEGFFNINANENDILVVNYLGMIEKEVQVVNSETVAILLNPDGEILEEIVLRAKKKKENEVNTGFGKKNEDALGFSVGTITADQIGPQYNNLADLLVGKFAGLQVVGLNVGYNTPKFVLRGGGGSLRGTAFVMFDIDGNIYDSSQPMPSINPQDIESITILKGIIAANRYGTMGKGGAIIIKTKLTNGRWDSSKIGSALAKGNDYVEEVLLLNEKFDQPAYLNQLKIATSFNEAKEIFERQKKQIEFLTVPYYIDVADYFMKWDMDYAINVLTNIASVADSNPKALKVLAFKLEELGQMKKAEHVYERILKLRPQHEQSYRDVARLYTLNGEYKKAMTLYKQVLSNSIEGVKFYGLEKIIANELMHLLSHHRSKVEFKDLPTDFLDVKYKIDIRIVFEWNDPNTEFELQFVNPQKKYFKWSHSKYENKERVIDEITYGYNTEEFIIDDAEAGEWMINIECLSKEPIVNPTYLKYTVFKNFGLSNETKTVKVIKLYQQQQKVTLDKFMYQK
jgi:hypothetical protein